MNAEVINKLKKNFELRNIDVEYFETLSEVKKYILNIIPTNSTIRIGHSDTLQKINITNSLLEKGHIVYDKELAKNKE